MTAEMTEGMQKESSRQKQKCRWEGRTLAPGENTGVWLVALPLTSCMILFSLKYTCTYLQESDGYTGLLPKTSLLLAQLFLLLFSQLFPAPRNTSSIYLNCFHYSLTLWKIRSSFHSHVCFSYPHGKHFPSPIPRILTMHSVSTRS